MIKLLSMAAFGFGLVASSSVSAAEKTVTLAVKNMYCAACPQIVRKSLEIAGKICIYTNQHVTVEVLETK